MKHVNNEETTFEVGVKLNYSCLEGYKNNGDKVDVCLESEFWSSSSGAKCEGMNLWLPSFILYQSSEAVTARYSVKQVFLKISQNSQKTPLPECLFSKNCRLRLTVF